MSYGRIPGRSPHCSSENTQTPQISSLANHSGSAVLLLQCLNTDIMIKNHVFPITIAAASDSEDARHV